LISSWIGCFEDADMDESGFPLSHSVTEFFYPLR
jgi:hypothetical protein